MYMSIYTLSNMVVRIGKSLTTDFDVDGVVSPYFAVTGVIMTSRG